jgi:hypothetical protein
MFFFLVMIFLLSLVTGVMWIFAYECIGSINWFIIMYKSITDKRFIRAGLIPTYPILVGTWIYTHFIIKNEIGYIISTILFFINGFIGLLLGFHIALKRRGII